MSGIREGALGISIVHNMFGEAQSNQLLRTAADYAARSITSIITQLEEDQRTPNRLFYDFTRLMHSLEVHFLFPNLGENDRNLVASLLSARSAMIMGLKKLESPRSPGEAAETQAVITHLKNRFADLKGQVEDRRLAERLTSIQQSILDREFLADPPIAA